MIKQASCLLSCCSEMCPDDLAKLDHIFLCMKYTFCLSYHSFAFTLNCNSDFIYGHHLRKVHVLFHDFHPYLQQKMLAFSANLSVSVVFSSIFLLNVFLDSSVYLWSGFHYSNQNHVLHAIPVSVGSKKYLTPGIYMLTCRTNGSHTAWCVCAHPPCWSFMPSGYDGQFICSYNINEASWQVYQT